MSPVNFIVRSPSKVSSPCIWPSLLFLHRFLWHPCGWLIPNLGLAHSWLPSVAGFNPAPSVTCPHGDGLGFPSSGPQRRSLSHSALWLHPPSAFILRFQKQLHAETSFFFFPEMSVASVTFLLFIMSPVSSFSSLPATVQSYLHQVSDVYSLFASSIAKTCEKNTPNMFQANDYNLLVLRHLNIKKFLCLCWSL